jgi:hypothetical protein
VSSHGEMVPRSPDLKTSGIATRTVCRMATRHRAPLRLQAEQLVAGRDFTHPTATAADRSTLRTLHSTLRGVAAEARAAAMEFADETGRHHVVVPDWEALASVRPAAVVGFFGQARDGVDHAAIVALEHDVVARAASFPGLLAYHNAQLASGQWGNLVVFRSPDDTDDVTTDEVHAAAVARTPRQYHSLRLHRGVLADGCLGAAAPRIDETLYLDFGETPVWRALRAYA